MGRLLFNVLAMVAEFETDLIRMRTREGMKVAKANGRLRGKQPKLKPNQAKHLLELHDLGTYTHIIPINSAKISAASTRRLATGLRSVDEPPAGHVA
jgi:DNA invertase Pin-like site-specific DNA recombinase